MNNNVPRCKPLENTLQITPAIQKKKKMCLQRKTETESFKKTQGL